MGFQSVSDFIGRGDNKNNDPMVKGKSFLNTFTQKTQVNKSEIYWYYLDPIAKIESFSSDNNYTNYSENYTNFTLTIFKNLWLLLECTEYLILS